MEKFVKKSLEPLYMIGIQKQMQADLDRLTLTYGKTTARVIQFNTWVTYRELTNTPARCVEYDAMSRVLAANGLLDNIISRAVRGLPAIEDTTESGEHNDIKHA